MTTENAFFDGGSSPPAAALRAAILLGDDRDRAAETICRHHYLHSVPSGKTHYVGFGDALIVWAIPANKNLAEFLLGRQGNVWALARLWAPDGHEKNLLTQAISAATRILCRIESPDMLVSYADPNVGHEGGVYRAASWVYSGRSIGSRTFVDKNGAFFSRRSFHHKTKPELEDLGYTEMKLLSKIRFIKPITKERKQMAAPDNGFVDSGSSPPTLTTSTAPAPAPAIDLVAARTEITTVWTDFRLNAEPKGLKLGEVLTRWRGAFTAQGKKGEGFLQLLEEVGVATSTAYYWIHRYEESIGQRKIKPKEKWVKALADQPIEPNETAAPNSYLQSGSSPPTTKPAGGLRSPEPASTDVITDALNFPSTAEPAAAPSKPKQVHVSGDENAPIFWKTLGNKLNALLPSYSDGSELDGADCASSRSPTLIGTGHGTGSVLADVGTPAS